MDDECWQAICCGEASSSVVVGESFSLNDCRLPGAGPVNVVKLKISGMKMLSGYLQSVGVVAGVGEGLESTSWCQTVDFRGWV